MNSRKFKKLSTKEFKKLCGQIRRSKKYLDWKQKILIRDNLNLKSPNVHHKKSFKRILIENDIKSVKESEKCKELWDLNNGITISKGEHRIVSLMERMKYNTPGFLQILKDYLRERE